MKRNFYYLWPVFVAFFTLAINGCMSISDSPSPRLYMPHSAAGRQDIQKFDFSSKDIIGVGPVRIPEYLNRPQMVTRGKSNLLTFAQYDRWAEPLGESIERTIAENLI